MSEWFETLDGIHKRVWQTRERGVADRRHVARHPTLATASKDGLPSARTVVLRDADQKACTVEFHTDIHSDKVHDLRANPSAELHIWDPSARLQIRLGLTVDILTGRSVAEKWASVPDPSRQAYGTHPTPGSPISGPLAYEKPALQASFAVLQCKVDSIDALYLGDQHRRAEFLQICEWDGSWVAP